MSGSNAASLKAKIRAIAGEKHVSAQAVLQNYMFERFLERLSVSEFRDTFILKGGLLIAAMVGLDTRSTMDMDATIRSYPLDEDHIRTAIEKICAVQINDDIIFRLNRITPIRDDDEYGGFRISLNAVYEVINTPLSIDVTSGDVITPNPVRCVFKPMFSPDRQFELWAYNVETVLAEKVETVLRRGEFNTRSRDFYDIYIITKTQVFNHDVFRQALKATADHRGTTDQIKPAVQIVKRISESYNLKEQWRKYQKQYSYAKGIDFDEIIKIINELSKQDYAQS